MCSPPGHARKRHDDDDDNDDNDDDDDCRVQLSGEGILFVLQII